MVARRKLILGFVPLGHRYHWCFRNYTETESSHCRLSLPTYPLDRKNSVPRRLILHLPYTNILARFVSDSQNIHETCYSNHRRRTWCYSPPKHSRVSWVLSWHCNRQHRTSFRITQNPPQIFFYRHWIESSRNDLCIAIDLTYMHKIGIYGRPTNNNFFLIIPNNL